MKNGLLRLLLFILLYSVVISCKEEITVLNGSEQEEEISNENGSEQEEEISNENDSEQEEEISSELVTDPDVTASFPRGTPELANYLQKNLKYPSAASRANISGTVILSFEVTEKGKLENIAVLKGIGFGCDEEAVRVVRAMPDWLPATKMGKKVRTKVNLPVKFVLE